MIGKIMQGTTYLFSRNHTKYEGIRPVNIYLMRFTYVLMFFVLGKDVWSNIFSHEGGWEAMDAVAWSVWAAFSSLALIGIFRTIKMIPILILEIFYKLTWLAIVALPLWQESKLWGSEMEDMTLAFTWVLLPIVAVPWGYVFNSYILNQKNS